MTGGRGRGTPPRELASDPQNWPHAAIQAADARVVQAIAAALERELARQGLSLRRVAEITGVNRQAIANFLNGDSWPDIATLSRLEDGLGVGLYPGTVRPGSSHA